MVKIIVIKVVGVQVEFDVKCLEALPVDDGRSGFIVFLL